MNFTYQEKNKKDLEKALKDNNLIIVTAPDFSGRWTAIKDIKDEKNMILYIKPEQGSLASIITAINGNNEFNGKIKSLEFGMGVNTENLPFISKIPLLSSFNFKLTTNDLASKHKELNKILRKNAKYKHVIFVVKAFNKLDGESKIFINNLADNIYTDYYNKHVSIIIIDTKNEVEDLKDANKYTEVKFNIIDDNENDFRSDIEYILKQELKNDEYNFIFKNLHGNIKKLVDIIMALSNQKLNFKSSLDITNKIDSLLKAHEITCDYDIVHKILCYMALLEEKVGNNDLATLLNRRISDIEDKTELAKQRHLINKIDNKWDFTLNILKQHFLKKTEYELLALNDDISELYGTLYPSRYDLRAKYANLANNEKHALYYTQNILQQIRRTGNFVLEKKEIEKTLKDYETYKKFLYAYKAAKNCCMRDDYQGAVIQLETVDVHGELLIEKKLFISQCKIKSIALEDRQAALKMLQLDIPTNDDNLKYRLSTRRISAFVHLGDDDGALKEYEELLNAMITKFHNTKSSETKYNINVVYRRCNNVLDNDIAMIKMREAVVYFREHKDLYLHGYYIALCNYFGILITNNHLNDAKITSEEIEKLVNENSNIVFPRTYIYDNDKILFDYFSKVIDARTASKRFAKLVKSESDNADNIFISSNYSIFLALIGDLDDALTALLGGANSLQNEEDQEGIYAYRVVINKAIFEFIKNNNSAEKDIDLGKKLSKYIIESMPKWRLNKLEKLKIEDALKLFNNDVISNAVEWESKFENNLNDMEDLSNYFRKAFVYTTVFNWDDD